MAMKILSIVWYKVLPPIFGGQKGIANFNEALSHTHDVICLCSADNIPGPGTSYRVIPSLPAGKRQIFSPFCWRHISKVANIEKADIIILEHPYHGVGGWLAGKTSKALLVVHSHNIESERFRQQGKWWWRLLYWYEGWVHRRAALNLFKTEEDRQWAITRFALEPVRCMVVPYSSKKQQRNNDGAARVRSHHGIADDEKILLFAGTLDYLPNARAVENIYQHIAPALPQGYKIIVCGRNRFSAFQYLRKFSHPAVINAGEIIDIDSYFSAASAFISPVQTGGGTQTKIIDAISYQCNVVAFRHCLAGISTSAKNKLFIAENGDWAAFINQLVAACNSNEPTPAQFFEEHDPLLIAARVGKKLQDLKGYN
jgi:hypothetical protein